MNFSRRDFFKLGGTAAAGIILGSERFAFAGEERTVDLLSLQNANAFKNLIGSEFFLVTAAIATPAVLTEVVNLPVSTPKSDQRKSRRKKAECFSLSFQIPLTEVPQATYAISHPQMGQFDLFMVPGRSEFGESLLHAIINRI